MTVMAYRTQDGLADYGFSIEFQSSRGWQVYIIFEPFRESKENRPSLPYQSLDGDRRRYVDWPSKVDSLGEAKMVAQLWAELAHSYQHAQDEHELYVELIQRYQRTQEQRKNSTRQRKTRTSRPGRVHVQPDQPHARS
jgi:hypothetical protein